jgi:hypothetical protein
MFFLDFVNIANIVAGSVAIIVSFLIIQKDRKTLLNYLFGGTQFFWGISLIFNALTFIFLHPTTGAQIIRDVTVSSAIFAAALILLTGLAMYKGEYFLMKPLISIPIALATIAAMIIAVIFDLVVYDSDDGVTNIGTGVKTTQEAWVMIFIYGIPLVLIIIALIYFSLTLKQVEESIVRKRILYFIFAYTAIIVGTLIFALGGIFEDEITNLVAEYVIFVFAEIFWVASPILMLIGFNVGRLKGVVQETS